MARRRSKSSKTKAATVSGAEPYKPKMTRSEIRAEILRVSGPSVALSDLRQVLPAARPRAGAAAAAAAKPARSVRKPGRRAISAAPADVSPESTAPSLSVEERLVLIDQAMLLFQELYAHLSLKRALHAIDPMQRLQLLRLRHASLGEREFHSELIDIFVSLRDLHTNYTLPEIYWSKFAFLPFRVEEYYVAGERKYLVSWVSPQNTQPNLQAGLEITHWNGSPIEFAVARNAAREAGSNSEARRARGVEALTLRWFGSSLPPDEDWVMLTCTDADGKPIESRHEWQVVTRDDLHSLLTVGDGGGSLRATLGLDIKTELLRRVRKAIFDAPALRAEAEMAAHLAGGGTADAVRQDVSVLPDVYPRFGPVTTPSGEFGYIRIATFAPPNGLVELAVNEFVRILKTLPPSGLILDVRGNGGGYINFGERILQTLSPGRITPEPFHFATTAFTLRLAESIPWLSQWAAPLKTALATGAGFSQGFPLTDPHSCNDIGQIYQGAVVLVTDALCYSTTDIFAAGFQDHQIGKILGCHGNTGAGGANVWDHAQVIEKLELPGSNPFVPLPGGAEMRVAARRSTRVGLLSGVPLEDLGVIPNEQYFMTRADLLEHNVDLIAHAAEILSGELPHPLQLSSIGHLPVKQLRVTSKNIDRIDILVNDRPLLSRDIAADSTDVTLPNPVPAGTTIIGQGYRDDVLVSSARMAV